jgi:hypothetical protein
MNGIDHMPKPPEGGSGVQPPEPLDEVLHIVGVSELTIVLAHICEPWVEVSKFLGKFAAQLAVHVPDGAAEAIVHAINEQIEESGKNDRLLKSFAVQVYKLLASNNVDRAMRLCKSLIHDVEPPEEGKDDGKRE